MAVNWLLGVQQHNPGETFANAFRQGQQDNMQNSARQAMAALVQNPNDPQALAALAKVDPASAMAFRKQQIEEVKAQLGQHYDSVVRGAEILRQFAPKDQQSYSQALAAAQAAGIDVSQVPQQYNPQYVDGVIKVADALKPDNNNSDQVVVTPQANAPAGIYNKTTGEYHQIYVPNDGSHPVGSPASSGPSSEAVQYLKANPNLRGAFDQKYGAGASAQILGNGGQTVAPSGGFPY